MPTKNPRINVVCEQPLFYELNAIAESQSTSVSSLAHDLIMEALELREDRALISLADSRTTTFDRTKALSFDQVFGSATAGKCTTEFMSDLIREPSSKASDNTASKSH